MSVVQMVMLYIMVFYVLFYVLRRDQSKVTGKKICDGEEHNASQLLTKMRSHDPTKKERTPH